MPYRHLVRFMCRITRFSHTMVKSFTLAFTVTRMSCMCVLEYGERPKYIVNNEALQSGKDNDTLNQEAATTLCNSDNRELASIHSVEDNDLIVALAQEFISDDSVERMWIGGELRVVTFQVRRCLFLVRNNVASFWWS